MWILRNFEGLDCYGTDFEDHLTREDLKTGSNLLKNFLEIIFLIFSEAQI